MLLLGAWLLVSTLGTVGQLYFEAGRPPFPPNCPAAEVEPPTETSSLLAGHGVPDREPLLFPDYQSSRPSSSSGVAGGANARNKRSSGGGGGRASSRPPPVSGDVEDPPPPYYPPVVTASTSSGPVSQAT